MRRILQILTLLLSLSAVSQHLEKPLEKGFIVKTNLLNLLAQRPTFTIEKPFSKRFSAEITFVQGEFNDYLLTDSYKYNGFLLRGKKYVSDLKKGRINGYTGVYLGNLKRNMSTTGGTLISGIWSYPSRDFSANSIRAGGSLGLNCIGKKKFVVDGLMSLGYGRYIEYYKADNGSRGYLDCQIWCSVGYFF